MIDIFLLKNEVSCCNKLHPFLRYHCDILQNKCHSSKLDDNPSANLSKCIRASINRAQLRFLKVPLKPRTPKGVD